MCVIFNLVQANGLRSLLVMWEKFEKEHLRVAFLSLFYKLHCQTS